MSVGETEVSETEPSGAGRSARARSQAETRRRLVDAGTALFAAGGLHAVTSAQIARRACVATGTFYLHFPDKQALFREIVFAALDDLAVRQERATRPHAPDSDAELRARTEELLRYAEDNRDLIRVVFGRGRESGEIAEQVLDAVVPGIVRRIEKHQADGQLPGVHPTVAAQAHAASLTRVIAWWVENPEAATRDEVVETLMQLNPTRPRARASRAASASPITPKRAPSGRPQES